MSAGDLATWHVAISTSHLKVLPCLRCTTPTWACLSDVDIMCSTCEVAFYAAGKKVQS